MYPSKRMVACWRWIVSITGENAMHTIDLDIYPDFISHSAAVAERFGEGWTGATAVDVIWFVQVTGTLPNRYLIQDASGCWYDADDDGGAVLKIGTA